MFDQCWMVLDAGMFKRIQHHPTMLDFSSRHEITWRIFDHANENVDYIGWKVWTKSNFIQHRPTLSNMFDCAVQTRQTCFVQQVFDNVWPTCLIRLNGLLLTSWINEQWTRPTYNCFSSSGKELLSLSHQ